jgi:hypothetical protein
MPNRLLTRVEEIPCRSGDAQFEDGVQSVWHTVIVG